MYWPDNPAGFISHTPGDMRAAFAPFLAHGAVAKGSYKVIFVRPGWCLLVGRQASGPPPTAPHSLAFTRRLPLEGGGCVPLNVPSLPIPAR